MERRWSTSRALRSRSYRVRRQVGRTHFRVETEYELLLTNRLILQPLAEVEIYGKSDPSVGSALASVRPMRGFVTVTSSGASLRRTSVTWNRKFFGTAALAEAAGEDTSGARLVLGVRVWF